MATLRILYNPPRGFRDIALLAGVILISLISLFAVATPAQAKGSLTIGGAFMAPVTTAMNMSMVGAQQAQAVALRSQNALSRVTQALAAMQAMQSAARSLALDAPDPVPDGLGPGGLVVDPRVTAVPGSSAASDLWINANQPTQATAGGKTTVTIEQTASKAILTWDSFNVGKHTEVDFNQTAGNAASGSNSWIALNKIDDPSGVPSQILGAIKAEGSVYLINQNGIIFGGSSQIDVHSLVASAMDLNDPGYANFLSGDGILSGGVNPSFNNAPAINAALNLPTAVTIQAGAEITAAGGDVLLLAPNVTNNGAINTPSGQALLVGGNDVLLATGDSYTRGFVVTPNPSAPNPNLPGGFYASTIPGTVVNNGLILAPLGNITIVGGSVAQNGVLTSTTSTTANGSINLEAQSGNLTLGGLNDNPLAAADGIAAQPSVIQILPDATDRSQITDIQAVANSSISLTGVNVDIRGIVQLRGYDITNANDHPGGVAITATGLNQTTAGQVLLERDSLIDTSGTTDAQASASRNSVKIELRSNELRDSPVVESGPLYQQTIYIDASQSGTRADGTTWQGTPLADASAYIALTTRSLDERFMNGAPVTIGGSLGSTELNQAPGSQFPVQLVQSPGSVIDLDGGYLTYMPGFVRVSELLTADGHLVSASNAEPDVDYAGICCSFTVDHPHWGVTDSYTSPLQSSGYDQAGYLQGGAGGALNLAVSSAVLGGQIDASVVAGEKQLTVGQAPAGSSLTVDSISPIISYNGLATTQYNAEEMVISDMAAANAAQLAAGLVIGTDLNSLLTTNGGAVNSVYLPVAWLNSGFSTVDLGANDKVSLAAGNDAILPVGGSLTLNANKIDVESAITAPGGAVALDGAYTTDSTVVINPNGSASARSGLVSIGDGVTLSVAGLWTNERSGALDTPIAVAGGTIAISSYGDIKLGQDSVLDVSGGGHETLAGKIIGGNAGTLTLSPGLKPVVTDNTVFMVPVVSLGSVILAGGALAPEQFEGYGTVGANIGKGGTLNLSSADIATITPASEMRGDLLARLPTAADDFGNPYTPLEVSTGFFSSGGFANVNLTAAGIDLPAGVSLAPVVASRQVGNIAALSAASLAGLATPIVLPSGLRAAAAITLHATGDLWNRGSLAGASDTTPAQVDPAFYSLDIAGSIVTDPAGSVALAGDQIAIVSGTVSAPGGTISLAGGTYGPANVPLRGQGVWLTSTGELAALGTQISVPQLNGTVYNDVLPGGLVNISGGYVILEPGSVADVSGATGNATLLAAGLGISGTRSSLVARSSAVSPTSSAGGTISISALVGGLLEGTLSGRSGGGRAAAGTLQIAITAHGQDPAGNSDTPGGIWPAVENSYVILQPTLQPGDADDQTVAQLGGPGTDLGADPVQIDAYLPLSAAMIGAGGFSSLILNTPQGGASAGTGMGNGYITFSGNQNLALATPLVNTSLVLPGQVVIETGTIIVPAGLSDTIQANYLQWNGTAGPTTNRPVEPGLGSFADASALAIVANTADLVGNVALQGTGSALTTSFDIAGDLRLTGGGVNGQQIFSGSLVSAGNLDFTAGQIYPSTETAFTLASATGIAISGNGAASVTPLSAGGVLNLDAPTIDQSGTLRAPTGAIDLGAQTSQILDGLTIGPTAILTLGAGGLTSVTANGAADVLFGVVQNGTSWYYNPTPGLDPTPALISAPPVKQITLTGANITVAQKAVFDASGGGDLYAGEFVPGTGGSKNIFLGANVYAVIPGYAGVTPYDPQVSAAGPSVGQQIYLNGIPGLPAGTYTLLPGQYAELPGAFRVTLATAPGAATQAATRAPITAAMQPDGSYAVSGYLATPGVGTDAHWSIFQVMSDAVARKYSEITSNYANRFFPAQAAAKGTAVPRLPEDAGQILIAATGTLDFQGTGVFNHPNGLGGIGDISAAQLLVVNAANFNAYTVDIAPYKADTAAYNADITHYNGSITLYGVEVANYDNDINIYNNDITTYNGDLQNVSATASDAYNNDFATYSNDLATYGADLATYNSDLATYNAVAASGSDSTAVNLAALVATDAQTVAVNAATVATDAKTVALDAVADAAMTGAALVEADAAALAAAATTTAKIVNAEAVAANAAGAITPQAQADAAAVVAAAASPALAGLLNADIPGGAVGGAADPNAWNAGTVVVLGAEQLNNLGVESLLLGGSRAFQADGVHVAATANEVVIANGADPLVLPDIQLVATPLETPATDATGAALGLVQALGGTGQVIIAPKAVIQASGAVAAGGATTYILSAPELLPTLINGGYASGDNFTSSGGLLPGVITSYASILANQIAYVRLSGSDLLTTQNGDATYATLPSGLVNVDGNPYSLPSYAIAGSVSVGSGAQLISDNSLTLFANGQNALQAGVTLAAQAVELRSNQISLGTENYANLPGLVLDQAALNGLAGVNTLDLVSSGPINLYGSAVLGITNPVTGQPVLGSLVLDSAGIVGQAADIYTDGATGTSIFTAENVTFQNTLGGSIAPATPVGGAKLVVNAVDRLGTDLSGAATGYNNATISLGTGAVTLAGFGNGVTLVSTGQIVATGDGGALNVQSALTLDAPRITAGSVTPPQPFTSQTATFNTVAYTVTAADNAAAPSAYYPVDLIDSAGEPALPQVLLGDTLTINGGATTVDTTLALPGGAFNLNSRGTITVGPQGHIDVSGAAVSFVDVLASIGGGNISLASTNGAIIVQSGATLNVGDLADTGSLDQAADTAGTLSLSAPDLANGGVSLAPGTLLGQGISVDGSGSFILDTAALDGSTVNGVERSSYDALAAMLVGDGTTGGFGKSWNIRARSGNIAMNGLTQAREVTVSTDTGSITVAGTIDAQGATGGEIDLYAGTDLTLAATAKLDAHAATADANGRGGQVLLAASQAGNLQGTLFLDMGAKIDVGADRANTIDSGPILGGALTLSASRNSAGTGVQMAVIGGDGKLDGFLRGVSGESAWDGVVIAGNQTYSPVLTAIAGIDLGAPAINFATGQQSIQLPADLGILPGQSVTVFDSGDALNNLTGTALSYDPATGILVFDGAGVNADPNAGPSGNWSVSAGTTLALTPALFQGTYLADAAGFMANESAIWSAYGANATTGLVNAAGILNGAATNQILVNIRPGINIENGAGDIVVLGDSVNWKGIDLSGSAAAGSVLNTGDSQTLDGHFGQYDEPIILSIRSAGDLDFGAYVEPSSPGTQSYSLPAYLLLGSLSDGFSQYTDGLLNSEAASGFAAGQWSLGAGASAWAAAFDPAASAATYRGLSGGLGADSATYFLTAGADLTAADPLRTNPNATAATLTVAGVAGDANAPTIQGNSYSGYGIFPVTTDPLYLYNFSWSGGNETASGENGPLPTDWLGGSSIFADYASLVRTGTGNISIGTGKNLVLQSPLSLIYTAGTGDNVNNAAGTVDPATGIVQPLAGFTQFGGVLQFSGAAYSDRAADNINYLFSSTYLTHGGDLDLAVGGSILGDMNTTSLGVNGAELENRPYDFTALGSQLKLENWITQDITQYPAGLIGSFNDIYATDLWMTSIPDPSDSFYTAGNLYSPALSPSSAATPGDYQLAWYTQFPYLENTIGSFGGGNINVKAGGSISNIQFVSPTNARDAGPYLVSTPYGYNPDLLTNPTDVAFAENGASVPDPSPVIGGYEGLYVQGGGNVSLTTGGDITDVYTYVQNGATKLQAGGSVTGGPPVTDMYGITTNPGMVLETSTGDVTVQANRAISIADHQAGNGLNGESDYTISGIGLIQNASILNDLNPFNANGGGGGNLNPEDFIIDTVLTGVLTSPPSATLTLSAVDSVTFDVGSGLGAAAWNSNQGILPAKVDLVSLQGDVTNAGNFITYPDPDGTVNLLARGSEDLQAGFNLSDADPAIMPTLQNIVNVLAPYQTVAIQNSDPAAPNDAITAVLTPGYDRILTGYDYIGGANYVEGQDTGVNTALDELPGHATVLAGDSSAQQQILRDTNLVINPSATAELDPSPIIEAERHAGLHAGNTDPARIIALDGDVLQPTPFGFSPGSFSSDPYVDATKAIEVYAGRDVTYFSLLGQNNNTTDVTSIVAGRDVIYPALTEFGYTQSEGIDVGGPGNVVVESGRNVDLGTSTGVQSFGNALDLALPSAGADITIDTGLGTALTLPDYAAFVAQYVNPASAAANQYAEPLELFDAAGDLIGSGDQAYAYLQSLPAAAQDILLNQVFFDLVRDSGREHTGAAASTAYHIGGADSIATAEALNAAFTNYQRAYAAIGTFLGNTSASGSFLGGLSTVRTTDGGNIVILSPHGQIQVGLATPPASFPGYSDPNDPTYALNFGVVTEKGGNIDLYADGDISVNQSRVFTLEGGDLIAISKTGNIDAGKGAKTVQAIQPPTISYDSYGNVMITPYGPASGSGLAVLRALPSAPLGNADLIAFVGSINAGDAGIRVSGNLNLAALQVLNAANIQVGGKATGIATVTVNIGALTTASNAAGAAASAATSAEHQPVAKNPSSVFIVEILGYGGGDGTDNDQQKLKKKSNVTQASYNPAGMVQVLGFGNLTASQQRALTTSEKRQLGGL